MLLSQSETDGHPARDSIYGKDSNRQSGSWTGLLGGEFTAKGHAELSGMLGMSVFL